MDLVGELVIARSALERRLGEIDRLGEVLFASRARLGQAVADVRSAGAWRRGCPSRRARGPARGRARAAPLGRRAVRRARVRPLRRFQALRPQRVRDRLRHRRGPDRAGLARPLRPGGHRSRCTGSPARCGPDSDARGWCRSAVCTRASRGRVRRRPGRRARACGSRPAARASSSMPASSSRSWTRCSTSRRTRSPTASRSPSERQAAGKPAAGVVSLTASHRGAFVVVEVADDGRGIDIDRLRRRAVAQGLRDAPRRPTAMSRASDALDLIFRARLQHGGRGHDHRGPRRRHGHRAHQRRPSQRRGRGRRPSRASEHASRCACP